MDINSDEFIEKLKSTFKIEAYEHLRVISLSLIELEKNGDKENENNLIETIHRECHSLKGASRAVNISDIEILCHELENIFAKIKKKKLNLNTDIFDIFNLALDEIESILSIGKVEESDVLSIIDKLKALDYEKRDENKDHLKSETKLVFAEHDNKRNDEIKKSTSANDVVRISKVKLDSLLVQGEEMIYTKLSVAEIIKKLKNLNKTFQHYKKHEDSNVFKELEIQINDLIKDTQSDVKLIEVITDNFMDNIKDIMLMPFKSILELFPKMVRDLSKNMNKEIEFIIVGENIEVDKRILEEIKQPLMHIIRNCIDHGIEEINERLKKKKNVKGTIKLNIYQLSGDKVQIEISDDGKGIDIDKIKDKVVKNNFVTKQQLNDIDDKTIINFIFKSGISTSDIITNISGRGLGLAIAYEKIYELGGNIVVDSYKDKGTTFILTIPITISTNRGIIINEENQRFVLPTRKIEKVCRVYVDEIKNIGGKAVINIDDIIVPIIKLKDILRLDDFRYKNKKSIISVIILDDSGNKIGIYVDDIITEQEVLVKRFNKQLKRVQNISGATILDSGQVVPILNLDDLLKSCINKDYKGFEFEDYKKEDIKKNIIVVEDSITSRTLLKNILENSGYNVKTAVDGLKGWQMIKDENFDIVITDVEMPAMDGFELTKKIREHKELVDLPVILVTSLESKEDIEKGIDVGASAYIIKNDFKQSDLLETVKRLI